MSMGDDRSIVYFVRHGEDVGNITRKIEREGVLTEHGQMQAKLLGEHLKDEEFTAAFASSYPRAAETAKIVLSESSHTSSGVNLVEDRRIVEQSWGIYEGVLDGVKTGILEFAKSGLEFYDFTPEGGEGGKEIFERLDSFLSDVFDLIDKAEKSQNILVVSHGAVYLTLWKVLPKDPRFILKGWKPELFIIMKNCSYFKVAVQKLPPGSGRDGPEKREIEILEAHSRDHLKPLETPDTIAKYASDEKALSSFKGCIQQ